MSDAGIDDPEQAWPSTNLICCPTMRLATVTACFGSQASSSMTILILRPSTPPASLIAAAAVSAPRFICSPMLATGPVIGPATAIVMSSARTGAVIAKRPSPVSDRINGLGMVECSLVRCFLCDRLLRRPIDATAIAGNSGDGNCRSQDKSQALPPWPRQVHSSGIPALRRPSYARSFASTRGGSPPCADQYAFQAAIVLRDPVEGSAR